MFQNQARAEESINRIGQACRRDVKPVVRGIFAKLPNADQGLVRFERLLLGMSSPAALIDQAQDAHQLARVLGSVLTYSQHLSDLLSANPEFASSILDPDVLAQRPTVEGIISEGKGLLAHTASYTHRLDRLRLIKQRWQLLIAARDIADLNEQKDIWHDISVLAEGLVLLALECSWDFYCSRTGQEAPCPLSIVCMGKFGAKELNYSSDLDLAFVAPDETTDDELTSLSRFCEVFRAALTDHMGRGNLYRVDLRLRPFGSQGPLVNRMSAVESYYERHAMPWEELALVRTHVLPDTGDIPQRWSSLRARRVFRGARSESAIQSLLDMRDKTEAVSDPNDLKRGVGGIRDVEFLTQIQQMLHGKAHEELQVSRTIDAMDALHGLGRMNSQSWSELTEGYKFLRKLEHRCQLVGNLQTHVLPQNVGERHAIASSMGLATVHALESALGHHRARIRHWYSQAFGSPSVRQGENVPESWVGDMEGSASFLKSLQENESSRTRVEAVTLHAPGILPALKTSVAVTEQILSGEIVEDQVPTPYQTDLQPIALASSVRNGWLRCLAKSVLVPGYDLGRGLSDNIDRLLVSLMHGDPPLTVIALGSYAARECSPESDADILVLADDDVASAASDLVRSGLVAARDLRALGAPVSVDLRLRPEGRSGRLATTPSALRRYSEQSIEAWERFALGRSRLVCGNPQMERQVRELSYGRTPTHEEFVDLVAMKKRIESERVSPKLRNRHVKLGNGGLDDISWYSQLWMLKEAAHVPAKPPVSTVERLEWLQARSLVTAFEHDALLGACVGYG